MSAKEPLRIKAWTWERDTVGNEAIGPWRPHEPPRPVGKPGTLEFQSEEVLFRVRVATRVSLGLGPQSVAQSLLMSLGELLSARADTSISPPVMRGVLARAERSLEQWEASRIATPRPRAQTG